MSASVTDSGPTLTQPWFQVVVIVWIEPVREIERVEEFYCEYNDEGWTIKSLQHLGQMSFVFYLNNPKSLKNKQKTPTRHTGPLKWGTQQALVLTNVCPLSTTLAQN